MKNKIFSFLKKCDYLSKDNTIYYNQKHSHQSSISGIITIICYFLIFFIFIYFCNQVLQREQPTAFFYKQYIPEIDTYFLNTSSIFHYLQLLDSDNKINNDDNTFMVFGTTKNIDNFLFNFSLEEFDHYYYGNCIKNDFFGIENFINDNNIYNSFCIRGFWNSTLKKNILTSEEDFIYPYLKYGSNSKNNSNIGYGIYIIKCQDISYKKSKCKNIKEINEATINLFQVKISFIDNNIDLSNLKDPIFPYSFDISGYLIGNSTVTCNNLNFVPTNIISYEGLLLSNKRIIESFKFEFNDQLIYEKTEESFLLSSFYFFMGNRAEIYFRMYRKFQDALADIGGISKALTTICYIINYLINDYTINQDINNNYFTLKKDEYQRRKKVHLKSYNNNNSEPKKTNLSNNSKIKSYEAIIGDKSIYRNKLINNYTKNNYNYKKDSNTNNIQIQIAFSDFMKDSFLNQKNIDLKKYLSNNKSMNCKMYFKSLIENKSESSRRLNLVKSLWKNKISEENIIYLSIQIDSINKNLFDYEQFSLINNQDFSNLKNY